ncbi:MAG: hypothetical protein AB2A00_19505 [Myxococcota bacterium]
MAVAASCGLPPLENSPEARMDALLAACQPADENGCAQELETFLTDDATWADDLGIAHGREEIARLIVERRRAGQTWQRTSNVDTHHDVFRMRMTVNGTGRIVGGGTDGERFTRIAVVQEPPLVVSATPEPVRAYQDAWNAFDEKERLALLDQGFAPDGHYVDPYIALDGTSTLSENIGTYHRVSVGTRLQVTTGASGHHGFVVFFWEVRNLEGVTMLEGMDVGQLDASGRLKLLSGFFGGF